MKTLVSSLDRLLLTPLKRWRELKAAAGRLGIRFDRWLNSAQRLEHISSRDLRVVGAKLRTIPPSAATQQRLDARPVMLTSNVFKNLRHDARQLGIQSPGKSLKQQTSASRNS